MKISLTFIACLLLFNCFGQKIGLANSNKLEKIKKSDIFEITIGGFDELYKPIRENCCGYINIKGSIKSIKEDSIIIEISELKTVFIDDDIDMNKELLYDWKNENKLKSFHQNDIYVLKKYKSEKAIKTKKNLTAIGGILVLSGVFTSLNTLIFSNKANRKNLLIASAVQFGFGLTLAIAQSPKKHYFKKVDDPWRFKTY